MFVLYSMLAIPCEWNREMDEKMSPSFASPPDRPLFNARVWEIVRQIPPGKVSTYGQIAQLIPPPGDMTPSDYKAWGARWVGGAMAACPEGVPWWRVINAQGKVSLRGGSDQLQQRSLLEGEGVQFDQRNRVNMSLYRWEGPSDEWLHARGLA
jgi:methylated-DNA-protein-cysteine methyltransferase-like protein